MNRRRIALMAALESMSATAEVQPEAQPNEEGVSTPADTQAVAAAPEEVAAAVQEEVAALPEETPAATDDPVQQAVVEEDYPTLEVADDDCDLIDIVLGIGDIQDEGRELDSNAEDIAEAAVAADDLEDLVQGGEKVEDTPEARMLLEVAVESIYNRLGIENPHIALEAGGSLESSVKDKLSSIKEHAVRLLRALLEAIKRAFESVRAYIRRVTDAAGRIEKNAIELNKIVRQIKSDSKAYETHITNQRLVHALAVTKQSNFHGAFANMAELVQDAYRSSKSGHVEFFNKVVDAFVEGKDVQHLREEIPVVLFHAFDEMLPNENTGPVVDVVGDIPEGTTILSSDLMPGNYVGILILPKDTAHLRELDYTVQRIDKDQEKLDLSVLSPQEMQQLLGEVVRVCATIRKFERDVNAHGTMVSRLTSAIKRFDQKGAEDIDSDDREFLRSITAMAPALARGIHERTFAYAVSTCANVLHYVEACVKEHADTLPDGSKLVFSAGLNVKMTKPPKTA